MTVPLAMGAPNNDRCPLRVPSAPPTMIVPYAAGHEIAAHCLPERPDLQKVLTMVRSITVLSLIVSLTGCGVAETGSAAASAAAAQAEETRQGLQTEARVREQLDAAARQSAERRQEGEAASQ